MTDDYNTDFYDPAFGEIKALAKKRIFNQLAYFLHLNRKPPHVILGSPLIFEAAQAFIEAVKDSDPVLRHELNDMADRKGRWIIWRNKCI